MSYNSQGKKQENRSGVQRGQRHLLKTWHRRSAAQTEPLLRLHDIQFYGATAVHGPTAAASQDLTSVSSSAKAAQGSATAVADAAAAAEEAKNRALFNGPSADIRTCRCTPRIKNDPRSNKRTMGCSWWVLTPLAMVKGRRTEEGIPGTLGSSRELKIGKGSGGSWA